MEFCKRLRNQMYDSAIEYMAREPPSKNEFHEVTIPHIPPTIITFAIIFVLNAAAIASAVTSPVACSEFNNCLVDDKTYRNNDKCIEHNCQ